MDFCYYEENGEIKCKVIPSEEFFITPFDFIKKDEYVFECRRDQLEKFEREKK